MCQNHECFCQNIFRNLSFKTAPSKNTFSKLHPQKVHFKKKVQKIIIRLIRRRKITQIIINMHKYFIPQCIYTLLKALADNNFHLSLADNNFHLF